MEIKPLTHEIAVKPIRFTNSKTILNTTTGSYSTSPSDATSLEISDAAQYEYKLSKSGLLQMKMTTKLRQAVKTNDGLGLNTGNYLEDLALAYDQLHKTLNEHSENSNKHGKYLDAAFRNLVSSDMVIKAATIGRRISNDPLTIPLHDGVNPFVDSARKHAEVFSDSFLKDYKKNGINAFEAAFKKLADMPETTSLSTISYNDLKLLAEKTASGLLNDKHDVANILNEHGLSGFIRNYLSSLMWHE